MNISYSIIHVDRDDNRKYLVNENKNYLDKYAVDLNSKTYGIYSIEDLDAYVDKDNGINIKNLNGFRYAEIGCLASHHMAWKTFYESSHDLVVILEDDIKIMDGFFENLIKNISLLPEDWDLFSTLVPSGNFSYYKKKHDIGNKSVCRAYQGNWSGGYVLNKSGAKKLLDSAIIGITKPVDIHIFYSPGLLNSYSVTPNSDMFLREIDLGTTIHNVERFNVKDEAL
jgi:GR25 family glycosyltransferase involved in LPS biosynthesis